MEYLQQKLMEFTEELAFGRNLCSYCKQNGDIEIYPTLYCKLIHRIREESRRFFKRAPVTDFEFYFLNPLKEAKATCCKNCEVSRFNFLIAKRYIENLIGLV